MAKRHTQTCPVAGFLNIFGDAWTLMIIREAFYGATRFSEIQRNTGIAKNLLSDRLSMLVAEGVLEREDVGERGSRYAYKLTAKGRSLAPVFIAMSQWSNEHVFGAGGEPVFLIERQDRQEAEKTRADRCGRQTAAMARHCNPARPRRQQGRARQNRRERIRRRRNGVKSGARTLATSAASLYAGAVKHSVLPDTSAVFTTPARSKPRLTTHDLTGGSFLHHGAFVRIRRIRRRLDI